jgi:peptidyl-dipeptidase A
MTGQRQVDAAPRIQYFAPLCSWQQQQNKGQRCG